MNVCPAKSTIANVQDLVLLASTVHLQPGAESWVPSKPTTRGITGDSNANPASQLQKIKNRIVRTLNVCLYCKGLRTANQRSMAITKHV